MLLIGGDSYLGRSLSMEIKSMGGSVTSFSGKAMFSDYSYTEFDPKFLSGHDFAVVVATPGHNGSENGIRINHKIFQKLSESNIKVYAVSTIHTIQSNNLTEYVALNREFEKIALSYSFRVIRVPNFVGFVPTSDCNQSQLLPWSLLENFLKNGNLEINSNLDSEFEWVTAADLIHSILILQKEPIPSIVEIQPGYKCKLEDLVRYFSDFALTKRGLTIHPQLNNSEFHRKIVSGPNPMGNLGWKSDLTDRILQDYFREYLEENWRQNA